MLEALIVLLYISGMAVTAGAIYGTMDDVHPIKASLALVLWPAIPPLACALLAWEAAVGRFK